MLARGVCPTHHGDVVAEPHEDAVRIDKWLWAARMFKTRALAADAIASGKEQVHGSRAKRAKLLHIGDHVRVRHGPYEYQLTVRALSESRAPAGDSAGMCGEDS